MMSKEKLLEQLQEFDAFISDRLVDLTTGKKRGIMQAAVYTDVNLQWNGSAFHFWNKKDEDVSLFLDADIVDYEFYKEHGTDVVTIHIVDCSEAVKLRCIKH